MKIVSQTANEMLLQDGKLSGMIVGVVFAIAGVLVAVFRHSLGSAAIWIGLAILAIGIGLVLFSATITVEANKSTGQILYQKKRLVGGSSTTYAIANILRIETRKQWQVQNEANPSNQNVTPPQPVLVAQSVMVMQDGREIPLDHQKTSSSTSVGSVVLMSGQAKETAVALQVANFLNVPFQEIAPPSFAGRMNISIG